MAEIVIKMNIPNADVSLADDGQSAFERVKESLYELIFMDYCLPDMHGSEVTRRMRKDGVKSIALSGNLYENTQID